jgi:hypothetical protein
MNEQTTIFLIPEEAKKFLEFQKNYKSFMLLLEKGVFNIRNGAAVINFDSNGQISTIDRNDVLYNAHVEQKKLSIV